MRGRDLAGQKFGRLTAIKIVEQDKKRRYVWECRCDCGNVVRAVSTHLRQGYVSSCGCLHAEFSRDHAKLAHDAIRAYSIDGTNVKRIVQAKTPSAKNKSGTVGVCFDKSAGVWRSYISFKHHRYNLGAYSRKNDAIMARKKAEQRIHGEFLDWYYSQYPEFKEKDSIQPHD